MKLSLRRSSSIADTSACGGDGLSLLGLPSLQHDMHTGISFNLC